MMTKCWTLRSITRFARSKLLKRVRRLGIDIRATAGKGDVGFCNYWTLEISVKQPVRVYTGMPIGQLIYFEVKGNILTPYNVKPSAKYNDKKPLPVESMMWKNSF